MTAKLITEVVNGEPYQYYPMGEYVVRAAGVCGGRPTFKYTRIEITGTLDRIAAGETLEEIVAGYGGRISREAVMPKPSARCLAILNLHFQIYFLARTQLLIRI